MKYLLSIFAILISFSAIAQGTKGYIGIASGDVDSVSLNTSVNLDSILFFGPTQNLLYTLILNDSVITETDPVWVGDSATYASKSYVTSQRDSLGTAFTSGQLIYGDGTRGGSSSADITYDAANRRLELNGASGASSLLLQFNEAIGAKDNVGTAKRIFTSGGSNDVYLGAVDNFGGKVYIREDGANTVTLSGQFMGIGNNNPAYELDVWSADANAYFRLRSDTTGGSTDMVMRSGESGVANYHQWSLGGDHGDYTLFDIDPSNAVNGANVVRIFRNTNTTGGTYFDFLKGDGTNTAIGRVTTKGSTETFFSADGSDFGIGISSPENTLHIKNSASFKPQILIEHSGSTGAYINMRNQNTTLGSSLGVFIFQGLDSGGTTRNGAYFQSKLRRRHTSTIASDLDFLVSAKAGTSSALTIDTLRQIRLPYYGSGNVTSTAAYNLQVDAAGYVIETTVVSDSRLKKDISDIDNAVSKIDMLRPVTYRFNDIAKKEYSAPPTELQRGFIAQEYMKIFPEDVWIDAKGYYNLDDQALVPVLVKAIQELNARIIELENKLK